MATSIQGALAPGRAESTPRPGVSLTDLSLIAMALIWGVNFSVAKFGTTVFSPLAFNGLRVVLAAAVLGGIATVASSHRRPAAADIRRLVALGLLGHGVYQVCFIEGLSRTPSATTALIFAASPAFIAIFGRIMGTERVSRRGWAGIGLQLAGMTAVVGVAAFQRSAGSGTLLGVGLVLAACLCWALFTVLLKPYTERIDGLQISAWTLLGGVLVLGVLAAPSLVATPWASIPPRAWGAVAYSGLGALVIAYLFWYRGVRILGPTRTAMFSNLQPIVALAVAYFVLAEAPSAWQLGGAAAIMSGLLVSKS